MAHAGGRTRLTAQRRRRAAALALACFMAFATAASAQTEQSEEIVQDPGPWCVETTDNAPGCDTEYTPIAKDGQEVGWTMISGELFTGAKAEGYDPKSGQNQTGPTVDFFTVSFANELNGFAGGAACDPATPEAELRTCTRYPVIYRYGINDDGLAGWQEVYRSDQPGYVGGVAWLSPTRALAVGGSGCYPRREDLAWLISEGLCPEGNRTHESTVDPLAGAGRVWVSSNATRGGFEEQKSPPGMTGLNALASTFGLSEKRVSECQASSECALAGGFKQIWQWKDGGVVADPWEPADDGPGTKDPVEGGSAWNFRVRQIRFASDPSTGARAVTSGCCANGPEQNYPSILTFFPTTGAHGRAAQSWSVSGSRTSPAGDPYQPDSIYSLSDSDRGRSYLFTPGGPEQVVEPGSYVSRPESSLGGPAQLISDGNSAGNGGLLAGPTLGAARLVAGDGDVQGHQQNLAQQVLDQKPDQHPATGRDGLMDWAVGELRSTGRPGARQAVAYTTTTRGYGNVQHDPPYPISCPQGGIATLAADPTGCEPKEQPAQELKSGTLFSLPSYSLNGFAIVGSDGEGWAVGDRGALLRLGGQATISTLPPETRSQLGGRSQAATPDTEPYEQAGPPLADEPGIVPALASRPPSDEGEPRLVSYGSPNPEARPAEFADVIAMSRDGSEGWAAGKEFSSGVTTLYHFDGTRWTRCRFHRISGVLDADPACAALRPLRNFNVSGVDITAIARIPLEYDSDPTNDDEFEAIAATTAAQEVTGSNGPVILRYSKGEWAVDKASTAQLEQSSMPDPPITDIAFSGPSEGWMVGVAGALNAVRIVHFDGERWLPCSAQENQPAATHTNRTACQNPCPAPCSDPDPETGASGTLPAGQVDAGLERIHLTTAGERIYLYGTRGNGTTSAQFPVILYNNPGPCKIADAGGCWRRALDPKSAPPDQQRPEGILSALSVAVGPDGSHTGWGVGNFDRLPGVAANARPVAGAEETAAIRSDAEGTSWETVPVDGPAADYLIADDVTENVAQTNPKIVALPAFEGNGSAFVLGDTQSTQDHPMVWFDPARERWAVSPVPWVAGITGADSNYGAPVHTLAPDNAGGFWLLADPAQDRGPSFYRHTTAPPEPVFTDSPHPVREPVTAAAAGGDGSFWVATASDAVYRYDRITGWDRTDIPGWEPSRVVVRPTHAHAIAIGADGEGVIVGEGGRIANVGPERVVLDRAADILCSSGAAAPCGTGRDLRAASVAPDGSAMVGGEYRSLLWRPAGGEFDAINPPPAAAYATITGISMPTLDRAWLVTDTSRVYAGTREGADWSWEEEALAGDPNFPLRLARGEDGELPLRSVAIDASGEGYAVGDAGLILERKDGRWRYLDSGYLDDLTTVALGPAGHGALIGGEWGLVLTGEAGRFLPARPADRFDAVTFHGAGSGNPIRGVALLPGYEPGQIEAWVVSQGNPTAGVNTRNPSPTGVLHYSSDPTEPLLDGAAGRAEALPDVPAPSGDELSFASFGRSDCQYLSFCPELAGSNLANDVIATRIREEILAGEEGAPDFALFTGDVSDVAPSRHNNRLTGPHSKSWIHRRWSELIAGPLDEAGVPLFGAIGGRDLSKTEVCSIHGTPCYGPQTAQLAQLTGNLTVGANVAWRQAMEEMPAPWGGGDPAISEGLEFNPIDAGIAVELEDQKVESSSEAVPDQELPTGGARTHYAFDVERDGEELLRVVVVDTSLRSLAASDALQHPVQEQLSWLQEVLSSTPEGARKVVLSNTPTYSYGPGAATDVQTDGTVFESVLMANDVDLVVSGRLGWNALYYALAPGIHYPCPGSGYPGSQGATGSCGVAGASQAEELAVELQKSAGTVVSQGDVIEGALPFVIASSAGGKFGPLGHDDGTAAQGYWRGYTLIRMGTGDDERIVVEQRPVFDWIGIAGKTHALSARQRTRLEGFGREPLGIDMPPRYDAIDSPAITHRYDLLVADPEEPWLPCTNSDSACVKLAERLTLSSRAEASQGDAAAEGSGALASAHAGGGSCEPYVCLPKNVGEIDDQTGEVVAGNGKYPDTFAIAMLSVGDRAATYAIAFKKSPSFVVQPLALAPQAPSPPNIGTNAPQPPAPPNPPQPNVPQASLPEIPPPPGIPPLSAAAPPEPQPPAPPAPPPPAEQLSALSLTLAPPSVAFATPTAVIQPPTPPVNPAPPSGARREARQRQAAAQKSGADSEEGSNVSDAGGDLAQGSDSLHGTSSMVRRDRTRPEPSFTAVARADQPSAWAQGLLYTGGATLLAATLALGWSGVRPTPRRRTPEAPAPAFARTRSRR